MSKVQHSPTLQRDDYVMCPSGLVLPETHAKARYAPKRAPVCIDLFCGCGGASLGFTQAGFCIVAALDNDEAAAVSYMMNLCRYGEFKLHFVEDADKTRLNDHLERGLKKAKKSAAESFSTAGSGWIKSEPRSVRGCANFIFGDIRKVTGRRILDIVGMNAGEVDCVTASPPCQGFSRANTKRNADDPRNALIWEWLRLVLEISPKTLAMENVPDIEKMVMPDGVPVLDRIARVLEDGSFTTVNSFDRALNGQAGRLGIMRRKPAAKPAKAAPPADPDQIDLFEDGDENAAA